MTETADEPREKRGGGKRKERFYGGEGEWRGVLCGEEGGGGGGGQRWLKLLRHKK